MKYLVFAFLFLCSTSYASDCDGWFIRGDVDNNGSVELVTDWTNLNNYLFGSGPMPCNPDAADVNDDGVLDISDLIALQNWFYGYFTIPAPYPNAGDDTTGDYLANDTSPMPEGQEYSPQTVDNDAYALGYNDYEDWDVSWDEELGEEGGFGTRLLISKNIQCKADDESQADLWIVDFDVQPNGPGHATAKALINEQNGEHDMSIKLRIDLHCTVNIDCACYDNWEYASNQVSGSLGLAGDQAFVTVELEAADHDTLTLGKYVNKDMIDKTVTSANYECVGAGSDETTEDAFLEFTGDDIVANDGVDIIDILRISQIRIDGIFHFSFCKISEEQDGYELSKMEKVETEVSTTVWYSWRE